MLQQHRRQMLAIHADRAAAIALDPQSAVRRLRERNGLAVRLRAGAEHAARYVVAVRRKLDMPDAIALTDGGAFAQRLRIERAPQIVFTKLHGHRSPRKQDVLTAREPNRAFKARTSRRHLATIASSFPLPLPLSIRSASVWGAIAKASSSRQMRVSALRPWPAR